MKTGNYLSILTTCITGLTLISCGGGGSSSSSSSDSPSSDSGYQDNYENTTEDNNNKPSTPVYSGWAPENLQGYTIKFNKQIQGQDTFRFVSSTSAESNTGNVCRLTGYKRVNNNTATFEKLFVSRIRYNSDVQDSLSAFSYENITLHFTSANTGTVSGANTIYYANGGFYAGSGVNSFTISK